MTINEERMSKTVSISYNRDSEVAKKEQKGFEKIGYVVTSTYWDDYDCGQILEYARGENREEVMERHNHHMKICREQREIRKYVVLY